MTTSPPAAIASAEERGVEGGKAAGVPGARGGSGGAGGVVPRLAGDVEAVGAVQGRQVEVGGKARGLAEHHVARARAAAVGVGSEGADDDIAEAVAVHI